MIKRVVLWMVAFAIVVALLLMYWQEKLYEPKKQIVFMLDGEAGSSLYLEAVAKKSRDFYREYEHTLECHIFRANKLIVADTSSVDDYYPTVRKRSMALLSLAADEGYASDYVFPMYDVTSDGAFLPLVDYAYFAHMNPDKITRHRYAKHLELPISPRVSLVCYATMPRLSDLYIYVDGESYDKVEDPDGLWLALEMIKRADDFFTKYPE